MLVSGRVIVVSNTNLTETSQSNSSAVSPSFSGNKTFVTCDIPWNPGSKQDPYDGLWSVLHFLLTLANPKKKKKKKKKHPITRVNCYLPIFPSLLSLHLSTSLSPRVRAFFHRAKWHWNHWTHCKAYWLKAKCLLMLPVRCPKQTGAWIWFENVGIFGICWVIIQKTKANGTVFFVLCLSFVFDVFRFSRCWHRPWKRSDLLEV